MDVHRTGSRLRYPWAARRYYKRVFADRHFDLVVEDSAECVWATRR